MLPLRPTAPGRLYLVATPIGNLEDITLRALRILREAGCLACEDTRHTRKLMARHGIDRPLLSYHRHNERERAAELLARIQKGESVALVSDAGMPLISDPGHHLVSRCIEQGISVIPIPGPTASVAALAASGLPIDEFLFAGFLPARQGERSRRLRSLANLPQTLVFYEAPHRLAATLRDALDILGDRQAVVAREITKLHEEFRRATLSALAAEYHKTPPRGEITLLIAPAAPQVTLAAPSPAAASLASRVAQLQQQGLDRKAALKQAARERGIPKREAYRQLLVPESRHPGNETP